MREKEICCDIAWMVSSSYPHEIIIIFCTGWVGVILQRSEFAIVRDDYTYLSVGLKLKCLDLNTLKLNLALHSD